MLTGNGLVAKWYRAGRVGQSERCVFESVWLQSCSHDSILFGVFPRRYVCAQLHILHELRRLEETSRKYWASVHKLGC